MRRYLCGLLVLLMLMDSYAHSAALAESGYLTLSQLCAQTPECWTQSYETQWRTVEIDAEIRLPDASAVPILALRGGIASQPSADKTAHWDMTRVDYGMRLILSADDVEYPKSVDGVRVGGPTSKGNWYGGFSSENAYVPMDSITFGEISAMAGDELERLGFSREAFDLAHPDRLWTHHIYAAGSREDILPGYLLMNFHQTLRRASSSIPYFANRHLKPR